MEINGYSYDYIRDEIKRAQSELSCAYFKGIFPKVPSWDSFLWHLNDRRVNGEPFFEPNNPLEILKGSVTMREDTDFYFYTAGGDLTAEMEEVKVAVDTLREILGEIIDYGPHPVGCFYNFAAEGFKVPPHGDDRETFFWQCQGKTTWNVYPPNSRGVEWLRIGSYDMESGDLLYLGHWVEHEVLITGPRAGIAMDATK